MHDREAGPAQEFKGALVALVGPPGGLIALPVGSVLVLGVLQVPGLVHSSRNAVDRHLLPERNPRVGPDQVLGVEDVPVALYLLPVVDEEPSQHELVVSGVVPLRDQRLLAGVERSAPAEQELGPTRVGGAS